MESQRTETADATKWLHEFANVISCRRCTPRECHGLLRDEAENVPQPGHIGSGYPATRILLVGQNPGVNIVGLSARDRLYTAAPRELARNPNPASLKALSAVMDEFVPSWPVHGNYFPLAECGLTLADIAYCNAVRCRTVGNAAPSPRQAENCADVHFRRWLDLLKPRAVIFIGKWAHDRCHAITDQLRILSAFMNRQRSLPSGDRIRNRQQVVAMVRGIVGRHSGASAPDTFRQRQENHRLDRSVGEHSN